MNLRERVESDLATTLEGDWGLPVDLISPDGVEQTNIQGQVLYSSFEFDPETGSNMLVEKPVVVLRLASLTRIPKAGERWGIRLPLKPSTTAPKTTMVLTADRPPFMNDSIGYIKLYPQKAAQR